MHQRRAIADHGSSPIPVATDSNGHSGAVNGTTSSNGFRKRRKRVGGAGGRTSFFGFRLSPRQLRKLRQALSDEDVLVGLIQLASILILIGCAITLFVHYFSQPDVEEATDDDEAPDFSILGTIAHYLGWIIQPAVMSAHKAQRQRMSNGLYPREDMAPSRIYTVPESLSFVGDKSDEYARLRMLYDRMDLPDIPQKYTFGTMPMKDAPNSPKAPPDSLPKPYDIFNCPSQPPPHYPYAWNLLEVLDHWGPDDPEVPADYNIYQGLCVFDYEKDYQKAINYRKKELPFVVKNDPSVKDTVRRWNAPGFMERMLGHVRHRAEYSESNHFLYWQPPRGRQRQQRRGGRRGGRGTGGHATPEYGATQQQRDQNNDGTWKEPTTMMRMTYKEWLSHANLTEGETVGPHDPHWYFRLIGCGETGPKGECDAGSSEYLFDELPFFQPKESLYIVDPLEQKGIHCRFGMHGVIAENHFDMSRNAIVVLGGERRYVLAHPNECPRLSLLPKGHPSARHSAVDWSDPDLQSYPEFADARGNEVVLQAGDVLYLPTNWFHFIISLNLNFQCNTRSGISPDYMTAIKDCGF